MDRSKFWTLALMAMMLAGCARAPATTMDAVPADAQGPTRSASGLGSGFVMKDCREAQAEIRADPEDFPAQALPPGFTVSKDELGFATILVLFRTCGKGETQGDAIFASVLVSPPADLRRDKSHHGILLSAWTDSTPLLSALKNWSVEAAQRREIDVTWSRNLDGSQIRVVAHPDFVLTVDSVGTASPGRAPYEALRIYAIRQRTVTAAFDSVRNESESRPAAASVHFIISPTVGDFVDHRVGVGRVLDARDLTIQYETAGETVGNGTKHTRASGDEAAIR